MQFILVTYDIENDRRRTKIHKLLEGYGLAVQYNVFELSHRKRTVTLPINNSHLISSLIYNIVDKSSSEYAEGVQACKQVVQVVYLFAALSGQSP